LEGTNNAILFGKTPLKAQNDYIFQKFGGAMAPLAPPGYAYAFPQGWWRGTWSA